MSSRGKQLLQLALEKIGRPMVSKGFDIPGNGMCDHGSSSRHCSTLTPAIHSPAITTPDFVINEMKDSDIQQRVVFDSFSESDSELDTVSDPDWAPDKKMLRRYNSDSESTDEETFISHKKHKARHVAKNKIFVKSCVKSSFRNVLKLGDRTDSVVYEADNKRTERNVTNKIDKARDRRVNKDDTIEGIVNGGKDVDKSHGDVNRSHGNGNRSYTDVNRSHVNSSPVNSSPVNKSHVDSGPVNKSHVDSSPVNRSHVNSSLVNRSHEDVDRSPVDRSSGDVERNHVGGNVGGTLSHGDVDRSHRDVNKNHKYVDRSHKEVEKSLVDRSHVGGIKSHGDVARSHRDVARSHGDVARSHGDVDGSHGDVARSHGDVAKSHGNVDESHGDVARSRGDIARSHGDGDGSHGDVDESHGDVDTSHWDVDGSHGDVDRSGNEDVGINLIQVDHEEVVDTQNEGVRSKRGMSDPSKWQRNKNKKLRMEGKPYKGIAKVDGRKWFCAEREERILGARNCSRKCEKSRKCGLITDNSRVEIFKSFWHNMDWSEKKIYVTNLVDQCNTLTTVGENSRRKFTFRYFLKNGHQRLPVCKNLFLSTLGIGEYTVYEWLKSINEHGVPVEECDKQQKTPKVSLQNSYARQFLTQLPKMPSHYCRATTTKQYLEPLFTSFSELHRVYLQDCEVQGKLAVSRKVLIKLFDEMNLSLFHPKKDQCDICVGHGTGNVTDGDFAVHVDRKTKARNEKVRDKERAIENSKIKVSTMDLQSVLICPSIQASAVYYKTKLACHNFTTHNLATRDVHCYFWHEGEGGLSSHNFATCIQHYIETLIEPGIEEIILFSDGCGYQNRNVSVSNALLYTAVKNGITIIQKYLEKGHTQMEVDSVHSTLERKFRKVPIYSPSNYVELIKQARPCQPYVVKYLTHTFFRDFSSLKYYDTIRPGNRVGDPCVHELRVLKYLPSGVIQFKLNFDDEYKDLPRRRNSATGPSFNMEIIPPAYNNPPPIKKSKYDHLQQLKAVIPIDYHSFYDHLPHD
ncbi:hypothetical protein SNE40_015624 [Patella caerulea]|uniref:Uncharacterized protein n=1 Tax=Patella caerulea TaxID=87958 RepID=A0AAN8JG34_PATCE